MKILIVTSYFPPEMGAAAARIYNLAKGLSESGNSIDVLAPIPNYPKGRIFEEYRGKLYVNETLNGCSVYRYWTYATISKNTIKRALNMISFAMMIWCFGLRYRLNKHYDCVIVQSPPLLVSYSATLLFKKIWKKKVILNVSDLWPLSAVELGSMDEKSISYKFFSYCETFVYMNADAIMGQSEEIIEHINKITPDKDMFLYRNLQPAK